MRDADRALASIAEWVLATSNAGLRLLRNSLFLQTTPPRDPKRIVVHLVGNVGDITVAIPALRALRQRYPSARITLFTSAGPRGLSGARELLTGVDFLDEIVDYSTEDIRRRGGALGMLSRFRRLDPDLLVMCAPATARLSTLIRNTVFARLTGAEFVTGLQLATIRTLRHPFVRARRSFPHEVNRYLSLLDELGVSVTDSRFDFGRIEPESAARIEAVASSLGPFVAICPGGKQVPHRWAAERFAEIARRVSDEYGFGVATIGSKSEQGLCEAVLSTTRGGRNLAGALTLRETTELLRRAALMITNDTGPMHLAAAVGTRVVAIFSGYEYPGRWYPFGDGHTVFRAQDACPRCLLNPHHSDHCVQTIEVDGVWAACRDALDTVRQTAERSRAAPSEN